MLSRSGVIDDLNVSRAERRRAGLAGLLALTTFGAFAGIAPPGAALLLLVAVFAANLKLLSLFVRRGGVAFAIAAMLFHQVYYC